MCFFNLWVLPERCATDDFAQRAKESAGVDLTLLNNDVVAPQSAQLASTFRLGPATCDCASFIGNRSAGRDDLEVARVRRWMDLLAQELGPKARVGLIQTWSPAKLVEPATVTRLPLHQVDEARLRALQEDELLLIRFSRW